MTQDQTTDYVPPWDGDEPFWMVEDEQTNQIQAFPREQEAEARSLGASRPDYCLFLMFKDEHGWYSGSPDEYAEFLARQAQIARSAPERLYCTSVEVVELIWAKSEE